MTEIDENRSKPDRCVRDQARTTTPESGPTAMTIARGRASRVAASRARARARVGKR